MDAPPDSADERVDILVVCTGNICRSPMAEGLLRQRLEAAGVPARVHSAGLVTEDRPASEHGITAMARRGLDIAGHRSRRIALEMVQGADLILGMERKHVREVAVLAPDTFPKAFTIRDLARRADTGGPRRSDETVAEWLQSIGAGRRPTDLLGTDPSDEVADPIGRPARDYERTAAQLEELVAVIVDHLFPQE